ncbi:unnamed protein product [Prunus armeniaca]|uniref:Uncharacterized protein n=1 Tax=Prunus armeniaca TaxID=36596 RepID=A0A6J5XCQ0_PRUAR|nr:unnamed protein product [Prunus armeniaca]CAB4310387.1 unnamed protein product [Prunus armeniaca]
MTNEEASDIAAKKLQNAFEEIKPIVDATSGVPEKCSTTRAHKFNETLPVRVKRCGKRLKRGKEKGE